MAAKRVEGEGEKRARSFGRVAAALVVWRDDPADLVRCGAEPWVEGHVADELARLAVDDCDRGGGAPGVLPSEGARLSQVQAAPGQPARDDRVGHVSVDRRGVR